MSWPSQPSKCRRVGSPPTIGPELVEVLEGAVNRRRHPFASPAAGQDLASQLSRQQTIPRDHRRLLVVRVDQGVEGHQQLQLNVHIGCGGLFGDAFDESVGHDLIPRPTIAGCDDGVGVLL